MIIFAEKYCIIKSKTRSLIKYKGYFSAEKQESVNEKAKNKVLYKRIKPKSKEVFKSARKEGERKTRKRESKKRIVTPLVSDGT